MNTNFDPVKYYGSSRLELSAKGYGGVVDVASQQRFAGQSSIHYSAEKTVQGRLNMDEL